MMIMLPKKIVLCGVSRSGKTTLGEKMQMHFGHIPIAFADPLKEAAQAIFGFKREHLWGPSEARDTPYPAFEFSGWCFPCGRLCLGPERYLSSFRLSDIQAVKEQHKDDHDYWQCSYCGSAYSRYATPRTALQTLGTEWGRRYCNQLWARSCFEKMDADQSYIVTDCRFDNERRIGREKGCFVVLLRRGLAESTSPHPSEAEIRELAEQPDKFDLVLDNTQGSADENFGRFLAELRSSHGAGRPVGETWRPYEDRQGGLRCSGE